jgi:hypothetical protein
MVQVVARNIEKCSLKKKMLSYLACNQISLNLPMDYQQL